MLDRAYGMSEALDNGQVNSNGSFVDVPSSAYYSKAVIAAKAFGIAAGTATGAFQPQQRYHPAGCDGVPQTHD